MAAQQTTTSRPATRASAWTSRSEPAKQLLADLDAAVAADQPVRLLVIFRLGGFEEFTRLGTRSPGALIREVMSYLPDASGPSGFYYRPAPRRAVRPDRGLAARRRAGAARGVDGAERAPRAQGPVARLRSGGSARRGRRPDRRTRARRQPRRPRVGRRADAAWFGGGPGARTLLEPAALDRP